MQYTWKLEDHSTGEIIETERYYATPATALKGLKDHAHDTFERDELNHTISISLLDEDGKAVGSTSHIKVYQLLEVKPHRPMSEQEAVDAAFEVFSAGSPPWWK